MSRTTTIPIFTMLVACGGSAAPTAPMAAATSRPSSTAVAPERVAIVDAGPPIAVARELEVDARTEAGAVAFLSAICANALKKDASWIGKHVSSSLRGNVVIHKEKNGEALLGSIADQHPDQIADSLLHDNELDGTVCDILTSPTATVSSFAAAGNIASGIVRATHDGYRFRITTTSTSGDSVPQLEELSLDLPAHPLPKHTKKHDFDVDTSLLHGTGKYAGTMASWFEDEIRHAPACIREVAAHDDTSSAIVVHAVKVDGALATVRLYASTAVSESLLACLEAQLASETALVYKGVPFDVEVLLHVLIPTKAAPGDGVIMMMGNP